MSRADFWRQQAEALRNSENVQDAPGAAPEMPAEEFQGIGHYQYVVLPEEERRILEGDGVSQPETILNDADAERWIDEANKPPSDEQEGVPTDHELRDAFLTEIAQRASATMNNMAETLRQQALQAFAVQNDDLAMSVVTLYFGPMTKYMAKAVERQPEWFEYEDDMPKIDATADELIILFEMQKLSLDKYVKLYNWWRRDNPTAKPWEIRDMVVALTARRGRSKNYRKVQGAKVHVAEGVLVVQAPLLPSNIQPDETYNIIFSKLESDTEILGKKYGTEETDSAGGRGEHDDPGAIQE